MKEYLFYLLLMMLILPCFAQEELKNVGVDDIVPPTMLQNIFDHKNKTEDLIALSNEKIVIIDFWATWCSPCLEAMPYLDSLAQKYQDELQLFTVTKEPKQHVLDFLKKRSKMGSYVSKAPKLFDDSVLNTLFPHRTIPHYVWLKKGKVIAITENVDEDDLIDIFAGNQPKMRMKIDKSVENYDIQKNSLFEFLFTGKYEYPKPKSYSLSMPYIKELGTTGGFFIESNHDGGQRITAKNVSLSQLYRVAFGKMRRFINDSTVDIQVNNISFSGGGLTGLEARDWIEQYSVCYELVSNADDLFEKIQSDLLDFYPQFNAYTTDVLDSCWVLEIADLALMQSFIVPDSLPTSYKESNDCLNLNNGTLEGLITYLEAMAIRNTKYPLVNETGYAGKINLSLCGNRSNMNEINTELINYGLRFVKRPNVYTKLVIRDNLSN